MGNATSHPSGHYVPSGARPPRTHPHYAYGPEQPFGQQGQRLHQQGYGNPPANLGNPYAQVYNDPAARTEAKIQKWQQKRAILGTSTWQGSLQQFPNNSGYLGPPASPGAFSSRGSPSNSPMMFSPPPSPSPRSPSWHSAQGRPYGLPGAGFPQHTSPPVFQQQQQQRYHSGPGK